MKLLFSTLILLIVSTYGKCQSYSIRHKESLNNSIIVVGSAAVNGSSITAYITAAGLTVGKDYRFTLTFTGTPPTEYAASPFGFTTTGNVYASNRINFSGVTSFSAIGSGGVDLTVYDTVNGTPKAFQLLSLDGNGKISWNYTSGYNARYTIGTDREVVISNDTDGDFGTFIITQNGTGGYNLTVPSGDKLQDGINVVGQTRVIDLSDLPNGENVLSWVNQGGVRRWSFGYYH